MLTSILIIPIIPTVSLGFSGFGNGNPVFELGGFIASEGKTQNIGIQNLVGNTYTTTNGNNGNVIVGVGYLFNGPQNNLFGVDYGLDAFYLAPSLVKGQVWQEQAFDNLNYSYKVTNIPAYALTKLNIKTHSKKYNITVDAGVGPNFVITSNYQETPNNSEAIPDNAFSGHTQINFSAMIGLGLKINHVFGNEPLECGYRFFYLGQGDLSKNNSQILNNLETSNGYAHAVTCSITL
jgi:hypothetical protein